MKGRYYILFLFFITSVAYSQKADFSMDTVMGCDSLRVTFINLSTPDAGESISDYNFYWDFEPSRGRDTTRFSHMFRGNGIDTLVTITLTMKHKNIQDKRSIKRDTIRLRPHPNAWFHVVDHPWNTLSFTFQSGKAPSDTIRYRYRWRNTTSNTALRTHSRANYVVNKIQRDTLTYVFQQSGEQNIQLIVSDWYGCTDRFDSTILISEQLVAPKFFTPNNDGINDYFFVETNGKDLFWFDVFTQRGIRVYHSESKNIIWDGIIENSSQEAPAGTYYFYIKSLSGVPTSCKGYFVLLRDK